MRGSKYDDDDDENFDQNFHHRQKFAVKSRVLNEILFGIDCCNSCAVINRVWAPFGATSNNIQFLFSMIAKNAAPNIVYHSIEIFYSMGSHPTRKAISPHFIISFHHIIPKLTVSLVRFLVCCNNGPK